MCFSFHTNAMEAASSSSDGSVPPRDTRRSKLEATGILVSPKLQWAPLWNLLDWTDCGQHRFVVRLLITIWCTCTESETLLSQKTENSQLYSSITLKSESHIYCFLCTKK